MLYVLSFFHSTSTASSITDGRSCIISHYAVFLPSGLGRDARLEEMFVPNRPLPHFTSRREQVVSLGMKYIASQSSGEQPSVLKHPRSESH